ACVGLDNYLAIPTPLEILSDPGSAPTRQSFIATQAQSCSASEEGCEEFTSVTANNTTGVEQRKYFSQVQACVLDTNPNIATFYTWEGTDTAGFQLKAWQLLKDRDSGPCTSFSPQDNDSGIGTCAAASEECILDVGNSNCRVFLDETGKESRRDITKVVTASKDCTSYRRTRDGEIWHFLASESKQCQASAVGCRQYKGSRANLVQRVISSNFERDAGGWDRGSVESVSYVAGGKSYKIAPSEEGVNHALDVGDYYLGKSFLLKFDAKVNAAGAQLDLIRFKLDRTAGGDTTDIPFIGLPSALSTDWRSYQLGPVYYSRERDIFNVDSPNFLIRAVGGDVYIDNIELLEVNDRVFALEQSTKPKTLGGTQPDACYNITGDAATAIYNSCEAYRDNKNNTFYVSRFDKLFGADSAYCQAVIDTQNSDSPAAASFNLDSNDTIDDYLVPADQLEYRIIKPENLRTIAAAGCTALGAPKNMEDPAAGFTNAYRQIDPDKFFSGALCKVDGVGCQAFQNDSGGTFVFRDPGKNLCAWSVNRFVALDDNGQPTSNPCPADWVAQCPAEQSGCTAYTPLDPNLSEGVISASFFIRDSVQAGKCGASEDNIAAGCVKFTEGYVGGEIKEDKLVSPQDRTLTIKPGRECAEWLSPTTTSEVNDPKTRSVRDVVYSLGRCQELNDSSQCKTWVSQPPAAYGNPIGVLQTGAYQDRFGPEPKKNIYNGAPDYSGYSIPNQYPLEKLIEDTTTDPTKPVLKFNAASATTAPACRSFPEEDSPFSSDQLDYNSDTGQFNYNDGTRGLVNVNKCEPGENCQCSYKKAVTTEGENKYYQTQTTKSFPETTKSITDLNGWLGYCVEWDYETKDLNGNPSCLAWWPVDVTQAGINIFDNHPEAGFNLSAPQYYCVES
ncbi:MAG: hypothetical protein Q8L21_01500, partial [Candidatus Komeilibacteria bacterium]|nr:hypothetical protein [Candidatus Komeilibacteria bacterium]